MTRSLPSGGRRSRLMLALSLACATPLAAQISPPEIPAAKRPLTGRITIGGSFDISEPRGEFKRNTPNGFGFGFSGLFAMDPKSIANIRADFGMVQYFSNTRRVPVQGLGGVFSLNLKTSSNIVSFVAGPQLLGTKGRFTPYAAALGGFSVFGTNSTLEDSRGSSSQEPIASATLSNDFVWTYGGAAGAYIRVYNGRNQVRLDLGARFLRHDQAKYLNEQAVKDAYDNDRDPVPFRGRADFATYRVGVNVIVF